MLLFWPALVIWFGVLPFLAMRLFCSMTGVRDRGARAAVFCLVAWMWWDHWQLPKDQTGGGYYLATHQAVTE